MTTLHNPHDALEHLLLAVVDSPTRVRLQRRADEIVKAAHEMPDGTAVVVFETKYGPGYSAGVRLVNLKTETVADKVGYVLDTETWLPMPRPEQSRTGVSVTTRNPLAPKYDLHEKSFRRTRTGEVVPW